MFDATSDLISCRRCRAHSAKLQQLKQAVESRREIVQLVVYSGSVDSKFALMTTIMTGTKRCALCAVVLSPRNAFLVLLVLLVDVRPSLSRSSGVRTIGRTRKHFKYRIQRTDEICAFKSFNPVRHNAVASEFSLQLTCHLLTLAA